MWYFAWILGIGLAASLGVINAMWLEARADFVMDRRPGHD